MNLKYLDLDLHGIPPDNNLQIAVFLIAEDLKVRKLLDALTIVGCDGCFCLPDLCDLVLAHVGFEDRPDKLYELYFTLLRHHRHATGIQNTRPMKEAYEIYKQLRIEKDKLAYVIN